MACFVPLEYFILALYSLSHVNPGIGRYCLRPGYFYLEVMA